MDTSTNRSTTGQILLVDNNRDAAIIMERMLQLKGYPVHSCHSGQDGLDTAERLHPAVIILDLAMPGLDGYEVCQRLRAQSWGASIRLIALSGYSSEADQALSAQMGFDAHLVKPVDWRSLTKLLDERLACCQSSLTSKR
jgi:CheY-like chemotaxis protein